MKKQLIVGLVGVFMLATIAVFFNASEKETTSATYKFHGEGSRSIASAAHSILNHKFDCPNGERVEDLHHDDMAEVLRECTINDSGKVRKLSFIEVNAVVSYYKSL